MVIRTKTKVIRWTWRSVLESPLAGAIIVIAMACIAYN